jgi:hypothetical protein
MMVFLRGGFLGWLVAGIFWAIFCWFFSSILLLIVLRDVVVRFPIQKNADFDKQLAQAIKGLRYTVEQESLTTFVCSPKPWLARLLDINRLNVHVMDDHIELAGPATVVNRVRKRLLSG